MVVDRIDEIVSNLARNISTNSNIPTQEKIGLVQALKELKDLVEDLGADIEMGSEMNETKKPAEEGYSEQDYLPPTATERMDGLVLQSALKALMAGAQAIIRDFKEEGYEDEEIYNYIVSKIKTLG